FFADPVWHQPDTKAQAHSVVRFLMTRPVPGGGVAFPVIDSNGKSGGLLLMGDHYPRYAVTEFVRRGLTSGWDAAAKEVYGLAGVDDLEAKWIEWLKTPGSKMPDPPAPPAARP